MRRLRDLRYLIVLLLLFMYVGNVGAQVQASARIEPDTSVFHVGDQVVLRVVVEHPSGYRVIPPELDREWGEVEVVEMRPITIVATANGETSTLPLVITAWEIGNITTVELNLALAAPDGLLHTVNAGTINLAVETLLVAEDLDLRDIKGQAALPFPSRVGLYVGLGVLGVGLLVSLFLWVRRNRRLAALVEVEQVPVDSRPINVIVLALLDEIENQKLPAKNEFKQHYTLVTDALRRYLEEGFEIPALEATTFEIRRALRRDTKLDVAQRAQVEKVLTSADFVKFAKAIPELAEAQQLPQAVREFVKGTQGMVEALQSSKLAELQGDEVVELTASANSVSEAAVTKVGADD